MLCVDVGCVVTSSQIPTVLLYAELFPILFIFNLTPTSYSGPAVQKRLV